jgi:5-methylcytosine-specific restriction endonuclease McrA
MGNKFCTKCNLSLDLKLFSPNKQYRDGFSYWCKPCSNQYRRNSLCKKRKTSPEQNKKNYTKHKEKRLLAFQEYYQKNKNEIREKQKKYRQTNKNYIYLRNRKRRNLLSGSNIAPQEIKDLIKNSNSRCHYCNSSQEIQIDHYIPLSKGGSHNINNLVVACKECNLAKKDKLPEDWLKIINKKKNIMA